MAGRYEDALRFIEPKPPETRRRNDLVYRAASLSELGRTEEARAAVAEALRQHPGLTIESFALFKSGWNDRERRRLVATMRRAGFPVCAPVGDPQAVTAAKRLPECVSG
jgi:hypothetical protein